MIHEISQISSSLNITVDFYLWSFYYEDQQFVGGIFQADKINMMNRAKFLQNGNCGYVLKPEFMLSNENYNLGEETEDKKVIKIQISRYSLFVEFLQYLFLYTYLSQQTDNSILRHFLN